MMKFLMNKVGIRITLGLSGDKKKFVIVEENKYGLVMVGKKLRRLLDIKTKKIFLEEERNMVLLM